MSKKNEKTKKYSEAGKGDKNRVSNISKYAEIGKKSLVTKNLKSEIVYKWKK